MRRRIAAAAIALALGTAGALAVPTAAFALDCTVIDSADTNTVGTLRYALTQAQGGACDGNAIAITVDVNAGATALPTITNNLTITGNDSATISVAGFTDGTHGVFTMTGGTVSISGVSLTNGAGGTGGGIFATGGTLIVDDVVASVFPQTGIFASETTLTATHVVASGNTGSGISAFSATGKNVIVRDSFANGNDGAGVDATTNGTTEYTRITANANESIGFGIGSTGSFTATDLIANGNGNAGASLSINGGGGTGTVTNVHAEDNEASGIYLGVIGGTINASALYAKGNQSSGFSLPALPGTITVRDSTTEDNFGPGISASPSNFGGPGRVEIYNTSSLRNGDAATSSPGSGVRVEAVDGTVLLDGMTISENWAFNGGGVEQAGPPPGVVIIQNTDILDNIAEFDDEESGSGVGGGVFSAAMNSSSSLTITDSLIDGNHAGTAGGGIALIDVGVNGNTKGFALVRSTVSGNTVTFEIDRLGSGLGGGLYIEDFGLGQDGAPVVLVDSSTFSGNDAVRGGGVYATRTTSTETAGIIDIVDSTISSQVNGGAGWFQGEAQVAGFEVRLRHSTVADNDSEFSSTDGGISIQLAHLVLDHTIITGSEFNDIIRYIGGTITANWNIVTDPEATTAPQLPEAQHNRLGIDPLLGPLTDNGGPTATHLLLPGSPAIDTGNPAFVPPPALDQRGLPRVVNIIDIGAVEVQPVLPATGSAVSPMLPLGALLLLVAGAALVARRRAV